MESFSVNIIVGIILLLIMLESFSRMLGSKKGFINSWTKTVFKALGELTGSIISGLFQLLGKILAEIFRAIWKNIVYPFFNWIRQKI
jgi:hypothetical protein